MKPKQMKHTEKEKLEIGINGYVDSWFNSLEESKRTDYNRKALKASYDYVSKQAIKVYKKKLKQ